MVRRQFSQNKVIFAITIENKQINKQNLCWHTGLERSHVPKTTKTAPHVINPHFLFFTSKVNAFYCILFYFDIRTCCEMIATIRLVNIVNAFYLIFAIINFCKKIYSVIFVQRVSSPSVSHLNTKIFQFLNSLRSILICYL